MKMLNSFNFIILHSRILFRWIQFKLQVLILSPSPFQVLSYDGVSLNLSLLAILLFRSAQDISKIRVFHSSFVQDLSRMFPHSSHLIQPVLSLS